MSIGKVIIITGDNIDTPIYEEDIFTSHIDYIRSFANDNNIEASLESSQEGACEMARLGHVVVKVENNSDLCISYLPKVITDRQRDWFLNNYRFENHMVEGAFSLNDDTFIKINGKNNILKEVERKNRLYERSDINVR